MMNGFVSLVGGDSGSAELLTQRSIRRLDAADLVFYDVFVGLDVLNDAKKAQRFWVGKRAGIPSFAQWEIEGIMIREAKRGKRVVRFKCGAPVVFGRGGQEAIALMQVGVPFEMNVAPLIQEKLAQLSSLSLQWTTPMWFSWVKGDEYDD